MATTTNYSWTTPDDTDLVKDGAAAIRTLGSSADTTVKNLNPGTTAGDIDYYTSSTAKARIAIGTAGQILKVNAGATAPEWATPAAAVSGLTLITNSPFTTVSSHSVNNCFTSTYANYKVLIKWTAQSADNVDLTIKLRASGSDTSTNYNAQRIYNPTVSTISSDNSPNGTDEWPAGVADKDNPEATFTEMEIASPQQAKFTSMFIRQWGYTTLGIMHLIAGSQTSGTQFDGFTLIANTGTMSGTVYVYGYQEA